MPDNNIYNEITFPPAMDHLLKRPDVENLLKEALTKPFTTIIAGAGFGKTQAVLTALKGMECKAAWIQLSELDNHVARFWERLVFAFGSFGRNPSDSMISLGFPESLLVFDKFLRLLTRELVCKRHYVLVLDDFHCIHNKVILDFFEHFLYTRIQNFSMVFISRTKSNLNMTGLQSKGLLTCITENDLRFSEDEMDAYFHKQGIELSERQSEDIYSYTNGWIFAIYLIGLVVRNGEVDNPNPVLAAKINIFDLIEEEIFSAASKRLQDLLVEVSALNTLPAGLLKELVGYDYSLISEMINISLFIRYDPISDSYFIHQLFREFLWERKGSPKESNIREMHLKAAEWFLNNNHKFEAIEHYRKCNLYDEIFDIILSFTYHVPKEIADSFISLIEQAPEEVIKERPIMRVAKAKYIWNNNRIEEAKQELVKIRKEYEMLPKTEKSQVVLGEVYLLLAFISIVNIDYEFTELFIMADKCLPGGSRLVNNKTIFSEGANVCSIKNHSTGELKKHQDALFSVAPYASRATHGCTCGMEYLNAAESAFYTGDHKTAPKYAYEAIYQSRQYQQYSTECMANFILVRIFTAKGDYSKITDILDEMKNKLENLQLLDCIPLYDIIEGWFYVKIGKVEKIAKWIKYEEDTRKVFAPVILGREYLVRSDGLLTEGRYYELLAFMEQTDRVYEARGILYARIQNKITKAIIHHSMGDCEKSINMLQEAYELTYPNNLIMQYIEYGNQMRTLIHAARKNESCKIPKVWLDKIYTKSSTYAKQLAQVISAYNNVHAIKNTGSPGLSKRESEVLEYLGRGLTREEIAESCYLAVGTVNDILNNIYNKLGAINAADAIRIAKEKDLL